MRPFKQYKHFMVAECLVQLLRVIVWNECIFLTVQKAYTFAVGPLELRQLLHPRNDIHAADIKL